MRLSLACLLLAGCAGTVDDEPLEDSRTRSRPTARPRATSPATTRPTTAATPPALRPRAARARPPVAHARTSRSPAAATPSRTRSATSSAAPPARACASTGDSAAPCTAPPRCSRSPPPPTPAPSAAGSTSTPSPTTCRGCPTPTRPIPAATRSTWHLVASDDAPYRDATGASLKVRRRLRPGHERDRLPGAQRPRSTSSSTCPATPDPPLGSGTMDVYPVAARPRLLPRRVAALARSPAVRLLDGHAARDRRRRCASSTAPSRGARRHGWIAEPDVAPGS